MNLLQRADELGAINEICAAIVEELDQKEVFKRIVQKAAELVSAETVAIPLISEDYKSITYAEAYGINAAKLQGRTLPMELGGLCAWVVKTSQPALSNDLRRDERANKQIVEELGINEAIVVPLRVKGSIIGGLAAFGKRGEKFSAHDVEVLSLLANHAAIAIRNSRLFENIRALKQFNEDIVQSMEEGILLEDARGFITFVNPKFEKMTGYSAKEVIGQHFSVLVSQSYKKELRKEQELRMRGESGRFELALNCKNGEVHVLVSSHPMSEAGVVRGVLSVLTDITDRKRAEEELCRKMLRYAIENGAVYLAKEKRLDKGLDAFVDLLNCGYEGMVITRTPPAEMKLKIEVPVLWLSEHAGEGALRPDEKLLEKTIYDFLRRGRVVLLDRLDYLITIRGFEKVLRLLQRLHETAYLKNGVLLISLDPEILPREELALLEKETRELSLKYPVALTQELQKLLEYINSCNMEGKKPCYRDIMERFKITKTTTRKWVKKLREKALLREDKKGRYKTLELTEEGRRAV